MIISYDLLEEESAIVADRLGTEKLRKLPHLNPSAAQLARNDLSSAQLAWIDARFETDGEFMPRYCGHGFG
ncbi:MAG TPA: hypothetical protein VHU18_03330 [Rhizomicrobium sp.]|nr:hypothetical protein [Rhizomicrobium sp.]